MINPNSVGFDIDGVVADTMSLFIDIAQNDYNAGDIRYEDMVCYDLEDCLDMDPDIIQDIYSRIMAGRYGGTLNPMAGAPDVLGRLAAAHGPVLFVTARTGPELMARWLPETLGVDTGAVDIVATGSFDDKLAVLKQRHVDYFVEDRLETCFTLKQGGVTPILYRQPWNRGQHSFAEVGTWRELEALIEF